MNINSNPINVNQAGGGAGGGEELRCSVGDSTTTTTTTTAPATPGGNLKSSNENNSKSTPSIKVTPTGQAQTAAAQANTGSSFKTGKAPSSASLSGGAGAASTTMKPVASANNLINGLLNQQQQVSIEETPNKLVYKKVEVIMEKMQEETGGVPIKTVKSFMSKIPSVFTGTDLIQWMLRKLDVEDTCEALHFAHLVASHGYMFPIDDHILTVKNDGTFFRFQVSHTFLDANRF
jgi:hypothetical protein